MDRAPLYEPTIYPKPVPTLLATSAVGRLSSHAVSTSRGDKKLWFQDVHCDPSATQNLQFVSTPVDRGLSFVTNAARELTRLVVPERFCCDIVHNVGLSVLDGVTTMYPAQE